MQDAMHKPPLFVCRTRIKRSIARPEAGQGFSIIELLVVIAIIAVLVSLLLPTIAATREAGRASVCLSNLRNAALTCRLYADDYKGKSPALGQPYGSVPNWALVVEQASGQDGTTGTELYSRNSVLICPTVDAAYGRIMTRTYAINVTGHASAPADPNNYDDPGHPAYINMERVPRPDDTPLFVDSAVAATVSDGPPQDRTASVLDFRDPTQVSERLGRFHSRHGGVGGFNSAFFDGSAKIQWEVQAHWSAPLP